MRDSRPCGPWLTPSLFEEKPGDVDNVVGLLGIDGKITGDELTALCPIHAERRPSFNINLVTGAWICHSGRCGQKGGLAWLVALATGCSTDDARSWLGDKYSRARETDDDFTAYPDEVQDYDWILNKTPPNWALDVRHISRQAATELDLGWGRFWSPETEAMTLDAGWLIPMRHMLYHDVLGYQGKAQSDRDGKAVVTRGWRKSKSLFGANMLWDSDCTTVIVVESPLDVAVLRSAGLEGGLATFGRPSPAHLNYISEWASMRDGRIVLAFDNDEAGEKYLDASIASGYLHAKIQDGQVYRWWYGNSGAKDPGEMSDKQLFDGLRHAEMIRRT